MAKESMPFELKRPDANTPVTQASEIDHNGQPLDGQIDKKPDVRSTEELANAFYIVDENGNAIVKLAGGGIKTKSFDSSQLAPLKIVYDCDFLIADNNGYAIALFKNGHLQTQKFNSLYSVQSLNSDSLSDFLITDSLGNVIVEFKDGHIKTKNFDSSQGGSGGLNYTQIY